MIDKVIIVALVVISLGVLLAFAFTSIDRALPYLNMVGLSNMDILHIPGFFILTGLFTWLFRSFRVKHAWAWGVWCSLFVAVGVEFVQGLLPDRQASMMDLVRGVAGMILFVGLYLPYEWWKERRR
jgi:hypothetical protein